MPSSAALHRVDLITRVGCHLCADAERTLRRMAGELGFAYAELDVDADPGRKAEYSDRVPVILLDGREHGYWHVEEARLRAALAKQHREEARLRAALAKQHREEARLRAALERSARPVRKPHSTPGAIWEKIHERRTV